MASLVYESEIDGDEIARGYQINKTKNVSESCTLFVADGYQSFSENVFVVVVSCVLAGLLQASRRCELPC